MLSYLNHLNSIEKYLVLFENQLFVLIFWKMQIFFDVSCLYWFLKRFPYFLLLEPPLSLTSNMDERIFVINNVHPDKVSSINNLENPNDHTRDDVCVGVDCKTIRSRFVRSWRTLTDARTNRPRAPIRKGGDNQLSLAPRPAKRASRTVYIPVCASIALPPPNRYDISLC